MTDYLPVVARAFAALQDYSEPARRQFYTRVRDLQEHNIRTADPPFSLAKIKGERLDLERAITSIETDTRGWDRFTKKGSTALLIVSTIYSPVLWILDFTSMSLFWVARWPHSKASQNHAKLARPRKFRRMWKFQQKNC